MEIYTELRKTDCPICGGVGRTSTELKTNCGFCESKGWYLLASGEEALCPECGGYGFVYVGEKHQCSECSGRGYSIHIFEVMSKHVSCPKCDGVGSVYEKEKCEFCFGFGLEVEDDSSAKGCPACASSGLLNGVSCAKCFGVGLVDFETGDPLQRDHDCSVCYGKGYIEIPEECSACHGAGEVTVIESETEITPRSKNQ